MTKSQRYAVAVYTGYVIFAIKSWSFLLAFIPIFPLLVIFYPEKLTQTALVPYPVRKLLPDNLETYYVFLAWTVLLTPLLIIIVSELVTPGYFVLIGKLKSF